MNLRRRAISGVKWTTVATVTQAAVAMIKLAVLARYLDKTDFGLMALVMFILGFMQLFMDMGISTAILHKQNITKQEYASLYWINFVFSLLLYLLVLVLAKPISGFYEETELQQLLPIMGVSLILAAIGRQFRTIEQKDLNFRFIAVVVIIGTVASLILAVVLAIDGFGVYALVYSALAQHIITNAIFFTTGMIKHGMLLRFNITEVKPFLKIGIYHVSGQVINYINKDLDILLIGKFYGAEILGGYSLAKQLVIRPFRIINPILTRVADPLLAKFQSNIEELRKNYLKLLNAVSSVIVPVYLGLMLLAPLAVQILYGPGFDDIIILVRILCVYMIFRSIANPLGSLIIATGRTDLGFYWNLVTLLIIPIAVVIGSQFSIEWVAVSLSVAVALLYIPSWWFLVRRMISVRLSTYLLWTIPGVSFIKSKSLG